MTRALELKVPPVAIFLLFVAAMWALSHSVPALAFGLPGASVTASLLAGTGLAVGVLGVAGFRRARTTLDPTRPAAASALVTQGVYRYTRNPMYLGLLLGITAWAAYLQHWLALVGAPVFVLYMNRFQIAPEERVLREKFGSDFHAYATSVRRWL